MSETGTNEFKRQFTRVTRQKDVGRVHMGILRVKPNEVRKDSSTGEDELPVMFAQGYGGDKTLPWYVKAFAKTGREAVGVGFVGKRRFNSTHLVSREGVNVKVPLLE